MTDEKVIEVNDLLHAINQKLNKRRVQRKLGAQMSKQIRATERRKK